MTIDGGVRIATTEVAPLGPSPDRREVDVPIAWIYLLTDPAPTGSAPNVVVGARMPCGYGIHYATAEKHGARVAIRLRARWIAEGPVPAVVPPCGERVLESFVVPASLLRLGNWEVTDAVPHGPGDVPMPTSRIQHVVPDNAGLAPLMARWVRRCTVDADCTAGGVCVSLEGHALCQPEVDPWLSHRASCPEGTSPAEVTHAEDGGSRRWRACIAACVNQGCPAGLACSSGSHCLPAHGS